MADAYLGEIRMFAGSYAPEGWAMCDGQILKISEYETLYTLLGTRYGGNGQTTFGLPDLRGRIPVHMGQFYTLGMKGGQESVTLTLGQIPNHTHAVYANSSAGANTPENNIWTVEPQSAYLPPGSHLVSMNNTAVSSAGGSQSHDNMMPSLVINFIIALYGIYPPRP